MRRWILLPPVLLALACGTEAPNLPDAGTKPSLFPTAVGNRWVYKVVTAEGITAEKTQVVTGTTTVDGALAYRFETLRADEKTTRSVQLIRDGKLFRSGEEELRLDGSVRARYRFVPPALRIDSNLVKTGDTYVDTHVEEELDANGTLIRRDERTDTYVVEDGADLVDVPAGNIECVRVRRTRLHATGGELVKTFWYAFGIGKVKELGGQTEELVRFEAAPAK